MQALKVLLIMSVFNNILMTRHGGRLIATMFGTRDKKRKYKTTSQQRETRYQQRGNT